MERLRSMDRRDVVAVPVTITLGLLLALGYETWNWSDTLAFAMLGVVGSIACICLWHVDWRPLRSGSRPRMHY